MTPAAPITQLSVDGNAMYPAFGAAVGHSMKVRSVFVFTNASQVLVETALDKMGERSDDEWVLSGTGRARIEEPPDWSDGFEETAWRIGSLLRTPAERLVVLDVSGRIDGRREATDFARDFLALGPGCAMDDYSEHLWMADELSRDTENPEGRRFFCS